MKILISFRNKQRYGFFFIQSTVMQEKNGTPDDAIFKKWQKKK
jgi:hypothetical protein